MANFTALKTAINNAIKTNGNEEITGAILQAILDAMVETLGDSAITDLENAITTEVTNRENAVGNVAADLAAEVQARQALDYNVNNRINAEEYNRQNADAALSQTMNQGFQTLGSQMTALNAAISALNAAYQNGYLYGGIATPSSSPSNNKCFYIALQGGTYTNFGGVGVVEGINIIKNDSGWKVEHIYDQTTLLNEFYLLRQQVIRAISSIDPIVIQGDVTNAPDEEDLTSDAQHLLKFKDRAYSPLNFSGLGMKILRKNIAPLSDSAAFNGFVEGVTAEETLAGTPELIFWDRMNTRFVGIKDGVYYLDWTDSDNYVPVSTSLVYMYNGTPYQWTGSDFIVDETEVPNLVNCLTQDMINEANTIYIIRYDYTLKEDITIPANCVLQFDGGSISGGIVNFQNTYISGKAKIISEISGSITGNVNVSWFGMRTNDDTFDNGVIINKVCAIAASVYIPWGTYYFQTPIVINDIDSIYFNAVLIYNGTVTDTTAITITADRADIFIHTLLGVKENTVYTDIGNTNSCGICFKNLNTCSVKMMLVRYFNTCVKVLGDGAGCSYNTFEIKNIRTFNKGLRFTQDNGGWANENYIYGCRFQIESSTEDTTGKTIIPVYLGGDQIVSDTYDKINNISITDCCAESFSIAIYARNAAYCKADSIRTEGTTIFIKFVGDCVGWNVVRNFGIHTSSNDYGKMDISEVNNIPFKNIPAPLFTEVIDKDRNDAPFYFEDNLVNYRSSQIHKDLTAGTKRVIGKVFETNGSGSEFFILTSVIATRFLIVPLEATVNGNVVTIDESNTDLYVPKSDASISHNSSFPIGWYSGTDRTFIKYIIPQNVTKVFVGILNQKGDIGFTSGKVVNSSLQKYGAVRPSLMEKNAGFTFFDTSLSPARPIYWNGSAWVDATGATV